MELKLWWMEGQKQGFISAKQVLEVEGFDQGNQLQWF
jgi:hypothetical protein